MTIMVLGLFLIILGALASAMKLIFWILAEIIVAVGSGLWNFVTKRTERKIEG